MPAATLWTFALNVPRTPSACACVDSDRPASLRLSCTVFVWDAYAVSPASGISQMALDYVTYCTAEGDRIILELQCARFLVKVGVRMRARAADGAGWLGSLGKTTCALCGIACEQPPPGCVCGGGVVASILCTGWVMSLWSSTCALRLHDPSAPPPPTHPILLCAWCCVPVAGRQRCPHPPGLALPSAPRTLRGLPLPDHRTPLPGSP